MASAVREINIGRRDDSLEISLSCSESTFLTMFGYSSEELQQLSFLDICIDEARDECRVPLRELREGVRLQYEIET